MSRIVPFLCAVALAAPAKETPPAKLAVLTFDDTVRSHLTVVAPILKEFGFGATFFATHAWMHDKGNYLDWDEIAALHRMGFEIGNHSWDHVALHEADGGAKIEDQFGRVEQALATAGVPRPVSLSWPGNHFGPEALAALRERGYVYGRRGPIPEPPAGPVVGMGPLYLPDTQDPLLIPTSALAVPGWTLSDFKAIADRAEPGKVVVFQFHGVPDLANPSCSVSPESFRSFMEYLKQQDFTVIAVRDLARYFPSAPRPEDPRAKQRVFR